MKNTGFSNHSGHEVYMKGLLYMQSPDPSPRDFVSGSLGWEFALKKENKQQQQKKKNTQHRKLNPFLKWFVFANASKGWACNSRSCHQGAVLSAWARNHRKVLKNLTETHTLCFTTTVQKQHGLNTETE